VTVAFADGFEGLEIISLPVEHVRDLGAKEQIYSVADSSTLGRQAYVTLLRESQTSFMRRRGRCAYELNRGLLRRWTLEFLIAMWYSRPEVETKSLDVALREMPS
jgi:hypothetical protein